MFKRGMTICLVLAMATVAQAGAVVTLTPDVAGPYLGGETLVVEVAATQDTGADIYLRLFNFDFNASDAALSLDSFSYRWDASDACRFASQCNGLGHTLFESLTDTDGALVSNAFPGTGEDTFLQVKMPGDGSSIPLGELTLTLPTIPGTYMLDALNSGASDPANQGAFISSGFGGASDPLAEWHVPNDVTGSMLALTVIPEPATLALLALGGIAALRRRRAA